MIVRRYGSKVYSVEPDFSAVALTEIAFRRDHEWSIDTTGFDAGYERIDVQEFTASGAGDIQTNVENEVLQTLLADVRALEASAAEGDLLMVENEVAKDFPRLHSTQRTIVVGFENRLHFTYEVGPPLRIGIYRRRASNQA